MPQLTPVEFNLKKPLTAISERGMAEHYRLYCGYVERYNELRSRLDSLRARGNMAASMEVESVKVDLTFALAAVKNHEIFFGMLGDEGDAPAGALADAIKRDFGSTPAFLLDLKNTAMAGRGWAWTVYDLDLKNLFNYPGSAQSALPVPNVLPIVAVDLYGHAYFYDFGHNKAAYVDALIHDIAWEKVAARFETAQALR